jgi:hypothetical protein
MTGLGSEICLLPRGFGSNLKTKLKYEYVQWVRSSTCVETNSTRISSLNK